MPTIFGSCPNDSQGNIRSYLKLRRLNQEHSIIICITGENVGFSEETAHCQSPLLTSRNSQIKA
jgi:hypothetical protein